MECPICYESISKGTTLKCGHCLHTKCLKEWYMKSEEPSCPLCRHFVFKVDWEKQKCESDDEEVLIDYIDTMFDEAPVDCILDELKEAQTLFNTAQAVGYPDDVIDYMLWDYEWISPKRATRNGKFIPDFVIKNKAPKKVRRVTNKKQRWMRSRI